MIEISPTLRALRDTVFAPAGFDLRLVGGSVRDALTGVTPKDIDLCTDASPSEQIDLYQRHGVHYYETGLQHGTLTVSLGPRGSNEIYEITSLRTESDHDGRWATMRFTRDWEGDLGRRDLTVNAMALDFDGTLYDPFGGQDDLRDAVVRFVGDANARIREDYLRILRWFRFHARIAGDRPMDPDTCDAVRLTAKGLEGISRERVWSEMQRIVAGDHGAFMLSEMMRLGVTKPCGLPHGSYREVAWAAPYTRNPITLFVAFLIDPQRVENLGQRWRWTNEQKTEARFLAENLADRLCDFRWMLAHDRVSFERVRELAILQGRLLELEALRGWGVPFFPLRGSDLVAAGFTPGVEFTQWLVALRSEWALSDYQLTKDDLIGRIPKPTLTDASA